MPQFEFGQFDFTGVEAAENGVAVRAPGLDGAVLGPRNDTLPVELGKEHVNKRWTPIPRSRVGKVVLAAFTAATAFLAAEAVPMAPGHQEAALLFDLGEADALYYLSQYQPPTSVGALNNDFGVSNGLDRAYASPFSGYAQTWWTSRAAEAEYVASLTPGKPKDAQGFEKTLDALTDSSLVPQANGQSAYDPTPAAFNQAVSPFVDDALWMGDLEMESDDPNKVSVVSEVFDLALSQWDQDGGGNYWQVQLTDATNHIRAIVSNATAVREGVWLYQQTGNRYYLNASEKDFNWVQKRLGAKNGYVYYDHVDPDGEVDPSVYTYTLMDVAVAKAALSQVDPKKYPLQDAVEQIEKDISYIQEHGLWGNPAFDSIWGLGGLWVASLYKNQEFTDKVLASIQEALAAAPKDPTDLLDFAGTLTLRELLKVPADQYGKLF
jgi:hypothetical protein